MKKYIPKMTGYKGTNADMACNGVNNGKAYSHKYELGKWYEIDGDIELGKRGFHFCEQPSGVWAYYDADSRIFKVEAEQVLDAAREPGADFKRVCRRIRLVEEVKVDGDYNTGDQNTGDRNTGDLNTGHCNTGNLNTGHWNTGDRNTGDRNTGDRNTGDYNTGDWNTGDWNTGHWNTGNRNTGNWNTGDCNTGAGNACDRSSGFFAIVEPKASSFGKQTRHTYEQLLEKYPEVVLLAQALQSPETIKFADYRRIPGITPAKLKALHKKHLTGRKAS